MHRRVADSARSGGLRARSAFGQLQSWSRRGIAITPCMKRLGSWGAHEVGHLGRSPIFIFSDGTMTAPPSSAEGAFLAHTRAHLLPRAGPLPARGALLRIIRHRPPMAASRDVTLAIWPRPPAATRRLPMPARLRFFW
jgi:hypothetical protein